MLNFDSKTGHFLNPEGHIVFNPGGPPLPAGTPMLMSSQFIGSSGRVALENIQLNTAIVEQAQENIQKNPEQKTSRNIRAYIRKDLDCDRVPQSLSSYTAQKNIQQNLEKMKFKEKESYVVFRDPTCRRYSQYRSFFGGKSQQKIGTSASSDEQRIFLNKQKDRDSAFELYYTRLIEHKYREFKGREEGEGKNNVLFLKNSSRVESDTESSSDTESFSIHSCPSDLESFSDTESVSDGEDSFDKAADELIRIQQKMARPKAPVKTKKTIHAAENSPAKKQPEKRCLVS